MIHIYGDSHARSNFVNLKWPHHNHSQSSVTMFHVGFKRHIYGFVPEHLDQNNTFVFNYGEVDCRCHIERQRLLGREVHEIEQTLVNDYINMIKNTITQYKRIVIVAILNPMRRLEYETIHGPIDHEFPFVGDDGTRVTYTKQMNALLKTACETHGFIFFDPFGDYYCRDDGTLKFEISDTIVHVAKNLPILEQFDALMNIG